MKEMLVIKIIFFTENLIFPNVSLVQQYNIDSNVYLVICNNKSPFQLIIRCLVQNCELSILARNFTDDRTTGYKKYNL